MNKTQPQKSHKTIQKLQRKHPNKITPKIQKKSPRSILTTTQRTLTTPPSTTTTTTTTKTTQSNTFTQYRSIHSALSLIGKSFPSLIPPPEPTTTPQSRQRLHNIAHFSQPPPLYSQTLASTHFKSTTKQTPLPLPRHFSTQPFHFQSPKTPKHNRKEPEDGVVVKKKKITGLDKYDSGSEVDESEELHNKKLVKLGKWGQDIVIPTKESILRHSRPESATQKLAKMDRRYKIKKINRRFELLSANMHRELTSDEKIELSTLLEMDDKITDDDIHEEALDLEQKKDAFELFKLSPSNFPGIDDSVIFQEEGPDTVRIEMKKSEEYYERHPEELEFPDLTPHLHHFKYPIEKKSNQPQRKKGDQSENENDQHAHKIKPRKDDDNNNNNEDNLESEHDDSEIDTTSEEHTEDEVEEETQPISQNPEDHPHPSQRPYSLNSEPLPEPLTIEDYKKILQKFYGQPANGNPELLYLPGLKVLWREDRSPIDSNGNMLPINYSQHHLHDPYDYFYPDSSTVFDPPKNPVEDWEDYRRRFAHQMMTLEEDVMKIRQSISCAKELHAFDAIITSQFCANFYSSFLSQDDLARGYSDRHWIYEAINHPDDEQRFIPHPVDYDNWEDFFLYDITMGPKNLRWQTFGFFAMMFGFGGLMAAEGVMAINQYFYDLEHPLHH